MKLRPSNAKSWMSCTAQPSFLEQVADQLPPENTTFTGPGTEAHALAAKWLETGVEPEFPSAEMHAAVKGYVELVRATMSEGDALCVEQKVNLSYPTTANGGTIDALIIGPNRLTILDLKYGQGVSVEAEQNPQLAIYAMSALLELRESGLYELGEDTLISMFIYQPRCREGEPLRSWSNLRVPELEAFYKQIADAAVNIELGEVQFAPSDDTCRFCRAKGLCAAYAAKQVQESGLEILDPEPLAKLPNAHALTEEQVSRLLLAKKGIISFLNSVEEQVEGLLLAGKPFPGWKLVAGRSSRSWKDEAAADKLLAQQFNMDERYEKKLISPAKAEKLIQDQSSRYKNCFERLVVKSEGKPTLAPETDPRPALTLDAASEFTAIAE